MHLSGKVRLNAHGAVMIPKHILEAVRLSPSDDIIVELNGDVITLRKESVGYAQKMRGLHREIWEGVRPTHYVREERRSWDTGES